jgi:two-component system response regulator DctR
MTAAGPAPRSGSGPDPSSGPDGVARVHIVDDDEAVRDALVWLVRSAGLAAVPYPSGEAFLAAGALDGCAVVDLRMTGLSGLDLLDDLIRRGETMPVIVLTGHGDVPVAVAALKKGALDFMEKPFDPADLVVRIRAALAEAGRRAAAAAERRAIAERLASLSPRERAVMELMLAGLLNKQIADSLGIAMRTVEVHRARILEKFAVRSAIELAGLVARLG